MTATPNLDILRALQESDVDVDVVEDEGSESVIVIELKLALERSHFPRQAQSLIVKTVMSAFDHEENLAGFLEHSNSPTALREFLVFLQEASDRMSARASLSSDRFFSPSEADELRAGGFDLEPYSGPDPVQVTAARYLAMLQDSLSTKALAGLLDVNESRIRQRLSDRSIYGLKVGNRWRIPRFQIRENALVPSIEVVLASLPDDLHPVAVWNWFHDSHPDLLVDGERVSPITWLSTGGEPSVVAELAREL